MQVFKTYFKVLKKQLLSILIYGIIFIGITIVITFTQMNDETGQFKIKKVPFMVVNLDSESHIIDGFLNYLGDYVNFIPTEEDENVRKDALFFGSVHYILTIPAGFTDAFLSGEDIPMQKQTLPNSVDVMTLDSVIDNYFNMANVYLKHNPNASYETLNINLEHSLRKEATVTFDTISKDDKLSSDEFNMHYFNYLSYIMISCLIIGVSIVMISFHGIHINRRHHASPITSRSLNFQLIFANFVFVMCYLFVFLVAGYLLNVNRRVDANTVLHWINAFVFALTVLSISYLIGISLKNKRAVSAASTMISLSFAFISGVFVPQAFLGDPVLKVASFNPTFWYVKANNTIGTLTKFRWNDLTEVIGYMAIQFGFAAAIISVALVVSKRKSQQAC